MKMKNKYLLVTLLTLPLFVQAAVVVDFDSNTQVPTTGDLLNSTLALNTTTPYAAPGDYTGADVYIGLNERSGVTLARIGNDANGGLQVRINRTQGDAVDGVFVFATSAVKFEAGNDLLNAKEILVSQQTRMASATIRFVVEDAGSFYISEASGNLADGTAANFTTNFSGNALSMSWFNYDPETSGASISTIGSSASPTFQDIDFVGFTLFGDNINDGGTTGSNYGVREFQVSAIPEPATMGLVVAFGGGILFIRRSFMM